MSKAMQQIRRSLTSSLLLCVGWCLLTSPAQAATFTVTNLNNSGPGSLRQAITDANNTPGDDVITFQVGLTGTINLAGPLPDLATNIIIYGPGANRLTVRRDSGGDYRIFTILGVQYGSPSVTISGLTITNGQDYNGGGIYNAGQLTLINCVISSNFGDGICSSHYLTIITSTICHNQRDGYGSGISITAFGTLYLTNSTLSGNGTHGISLGDNGSAAFITNSTIYNNSFGIFNMAFANITLRNTILADNQNGNCDSGIMSQGNNLSSDNTCYHFNQPGDLNNTDPRLGALKDNGGPTPTHQPLPGSPAIDAGDNTGLGYPALQLTDQRGLPRLAGLAIDIGAVEASSLAIYPDTLDNGTVGQSYSASFQTQGGASPYTYKLANGVLPNGLTLKNGLLSGTPIQGGDFNFTVKATDAEGREGTRAYTLVIKCATLSLTPATVPNGTVGVPYNQSFTATGGYGIVRLTSTGTLPPGLSFQGDKLSGKPSQAGNFEFTVIATDASGCSVGQSYTLKIN